MIPSVTHVSFTPAPRLDQLDGLLGWAAADIDGRMRVDGFTIRRARDGRLRAFLPERKARAGYLHPIVAFHEGRDERAVERAILRELRRQGVLP